MRKKEAFGPPNVWLTSFMTTPMIIDAVTQGMGLRMSTNEFRLITGLLFGTALTPFLVYSMSQISISEKLPCLRNVFPANIRFDDTNSWLGYKALSVGMLINGIISFLIISTGPYINNVFYWLISSSIVVSIILHIFLLPFFLIMYACIQLWNNLTKKLTS